MSTEDNTASRTQPILAQSGQPNAAPSGAGEFGHFWQRGGGVCIDGWGAGPFTITADGKAFRFEDSDRFGPSLVKQNGDIRANPFPPERSGFWRAHRAWVLQGRRLASDGHSCVWTEMEPNYFRRLRGKHAAVVQAGDDDGAWIELRPGEQPPPRLSPANASGEAAAPPQVEGDKSSGGNQ